jgi:endonuclease YncB( thermonuclease family)
MRGFHLGWTFVVMLGVAAPAAAQRVTKVTSGDTVVIHGVGKVRLIGITSIDEAPFEVGNAPRSEPRQIPPPSPGMPGSSPPTAIFNGGVKLTPDRPSRDFLQHLVLGKTVRLQYDPLIAEGKERRAYLFLQDDTLVNLEMIRQGKAKVDDGVPFAHEQEFIEAQSDAQTAGLGVWAAGPKP